MVLYLRVLSYDMKFRGLLGYARPNSDNTKRVGDWEQPDIDLFASPWPQGNACQGGLTHASARIKPYLTKLYWRAPPAGTGTVYFEFIIKQGDANTGAFFYMNNGKLTLTESTAAVVPQSVFQATAGLTCTAYCASVGASCSQPSQTALATPNGLTEFQNKVSPWYSCSHMFATCGNPSDPLRLPNTNDCTYIDNTMCVSPATPQSSCGALADPANPRLCACVPDPCNPSPCNSQGGNCSVDTSKPLSESAYICTCNTGFSGPTCSNLAPTCGKTGNPSFPCLNGGTCMAGATAVTCDCSTSTGGAWTGTTCEVPPPCNSNPCTTKDTAATCTNYDQGGRNFTAACLCSAGYSGPLCTVIDGCVLRNLRNQQCLNGGVCRDNPDDTSATDSSCDCLGIGFTGSRCQTDLDECVFGTDPCIHGRCTNLVGTFNCTCDPTWSGTLCNQPDGTQWCPSNPCGGNGDTCVECPGSAGCTAADLGNFSSSFKCTCKPGWSGKSCNILVDYCATAPCKNGATCVNNADPSTGTCQCPTGYTGTLCDVDINECSPANPCQNSGRCVNLPGAFSCNCSGTSFIGPLCETSVGVNVTNWCSANPCSTVGTIPGGCYECPGPNCTAADIPAGESTSYHCECNSGFSGKQCTIQSYCNSPPCVHGRCVEDPLDSSQGSCQCDLGYEGPLCDTDTNECASTPCLHSGNCTNLVGAYKCDCVSPYTGVNCESNPNMPPTTTWCSPVSPCVNSKACWECPSDSRCTAADTALTATSFHCDCEFGFTGKQCNQVIDFCATAPCQNGGVCTTDVTKASGYQCTCPSGYTGANCETNIDECLLTPQNPCANGGTCVDGLHSFTCQCLAGFNGVTCNNRAPIITVGCSAATDCPPGIACTGSGSCDFIPCSAGGTTCPTGYICSGDDVPKQPLVRYCKVEVSNLGNDAPCTLDENCASGYCGTNTQGQNVCSDRVNSASSLSLALALALLL